MCGLVAMITKNRNGFSTANMDAFATMLFVDQLRGPDSTGVFLVNNLGNVKVAKSAQNATDYLGEAEWKNLRIDGIRNGWAMVGHNRKATRGDINDKNAHPFWVDDKLILVHNGSYYGDHSHLKDTEVDSEAIAHVLADAGNEVEGALQKINAAYALIWYDVKEKKLRVIRNAQRPLHWMETDDAWYFCSEPDFLMFAAMRNNLKVQGKGPHPFDIASLDEWKLEDDRSTSLETTDLKINYVAPVTAPSAPNFTTVGESCDRHFPSGWGYGGHWETEDNRATEPPALTAAIEAANEAASEAIRKASDQYALTQVETKPVTPGPIPDWAEKYTKGEWEKAKLIYATGHKVKVECKDYLADDAGPDKVFLTGKTLDDWGLYVIFPVNKRLFSAITAPDSQFAKGKNAHFQVTVDICGWRPKDPDDNMSKGLITLTGTEPKVLMVGGSSVQ